MEKLPQGAGASPTEDRPICAGLGLMKAAQQGRQHMAIGGVVVVPRAIEVGRHQADGIKAVLAAQGLTQLDAADLGDGVQRIGRFQCAGEQRLLTDLLLGKFRIDATAAQKQQPADQAASMTLVWILRLSNRKSAGKMFGGSQHLHVRARLLHPLLHGSVRPELIEKALPPAGVDAGVEVVHAGVRLS